MNEKELIKEWYFDNAIIRKPKLKDACDVICDLCVEVKKAISRPFTAYQHQE